MGFYRIQGTMTLLHGLNHDDGDSDDDGDDDDDDVFFFASRER